MKKLSVKIGEHVVLFETSSERFVPWIQRHYQTIDSSNLPPDLFIRIEDGYGIPFKDYEVDITSNSRKLTYQRADYCIKVNPDYNDAVISFYDELALKHALTNLYSAFIVHNNWGLLIHSSCVLEDGKAYLFAGQSGAGKSTVARLSAPRSIFSDEATLVKIGENGIRVFDSPFRSELISTYFLEPCSLSSIYLLNQSLDVKTSPVKKSDSLVRILDKVFHWHYDTAETAKLLNMCTQLIKQVPVHNMYFQKNNTFWELIS